MYLPCLEVSISSLLRRERPVMIQMIYLYIGPTSEKAKQKPPNLRAVSRSSDEACRGLVEASLRLRQLALHLFLDRFRSIRVHIRVVL